MQEVKALFGVCLFFLINQTNYFVCGFSCSFKKENLIKFVMCCRCTSRMKNASVTSCLTYCCQERESGITTADTGVAQLSVLVALVVKNMAVTWLLLMVITVSTCSGCCCDAFAHWALPCSYCMFATHRHRTGIISKSTRLNTAEHIHSIIEWTASRSEGEVRKITTNPATASPSQQGEQLQLCSQSAAAYCGIVTILKRAAHASCRYCIMYFFIRVFSFCLTVYKD